MEYSLNEESSLSNYRHSSQPLKQPLVDQLVEVEEETLLKLIKFGTNGERELAIGVLFDRHCQYVSKMISRKGIFGSDAEDVFGDIWKIIVEKIVDFEYKGIPMIHWFSKITRIQIDAYFRKKGEENARLIFPEDERLESIAAVKNITGSKLNFEQSPKLRNLITNILPKLIEKLSEKEKEVIKLAYFEGLDSSQIAQKINSKSGTVRQRKRRALNKLKLLGEKGTDNDIKKS